MKTLQQTRFSVNLSKDVLRHEKLEGRDFIVAPMAMLAEGVIPGSNGPLFYPSEEIARNPLTWNHKPVVIYHPEINGKPVSACSPEIIDSRKVGIVLNAKWEEGKLRAEAWLEESRLKTVDSRVLDMLEKGDKIEISTGLFTDNEEGEGTYNGKDYTHTARYHQPDHLAILPDKIGAYSIEDGGGLLQTNELSMDATRAQLSVALRFKFAGDLDSSGYPCLPYICDVFSTFVIYEGKSGDLFKMNYTRTDSEVKLTGTPVEVVRVTEYRTKSEGGYVANASNNPKIPVTEIEDMTKAEKANALIANARTKFGEPHRAWLMTLNDDQLDAMLPEEAAPVVPPVVTAPPAVTAPAHVPAPVVPVANTVESYIASAPGPIQSVLKAGVQQLAKRKAGLIANIQAAPGNVFTVEYLQSRETEELEGMAALSANAIPGQRQSYDGGQPVSILMNSQQAPITEEPMLAPTMNFKKA